MAAVSFKDGIAIIYDSEGKYVAKSIISEHNRTSMYIEVAADIEAGERLTLMILHPGGAYEFDGVSKRKTFTACEIALFKQRDRSLRGSARHVLNTPATVNSITIGTIKRSMDPPAPIIIENISTTGALIKSDQKSFPLFSVLELDVDLGGKKGQLQGTVIRQKENRDGTFSFACKFVFEKL